MIKLKSIIENKKENLKETLVLPANTINTLLPAELFNGPMNSGKDLSNDLIKTLNAFFKKNSINTRIKER